MEKKHKKLVAKVQNLKKEAEELNHILTNTRAESAVDILDVLVSEVRSMRVEMKRITRRQDHQDKFCADLLKVLQADHLETKESNRKVRRELESVKTFHNVYAQKFAKLSWNLTDWHQESQKDMVKIYDRVENFAKIALKKQKEQQKQVKKEKKKERKRKAALKAQKAQELAMNKNERKPIQKPPINEEIIGSWKMIACENVAEYLQKPNHADTFSNDLKFKISGDKLIWTYKSSNSMDHLRQTTSEKSCYQKKNQIRTVYKEDGKEVERICRYTENGKLVITAQRKDASCKWIYKRIS